MKGYTEADLEDIQSGSMPAWKLDGHTVLDIGCQEGDHLARGPFRECVRLCGIDPDEAAILKGRGKYPHMELVVGFAEKLPWHESSFSFIRSNVSLPYTDLPVAFAEAYRVGAKKARIHFTLHDIEHEKVFFWDQAVLGRRPDLNGKPSPKSIIDHVVYIWPHSFVLAWIGKCFPRPWKKIGQRYESFQTKRRIRRIAKDVGFVDVKVFRTFKHFVLQGRKP